MGIIDFYCHKAALVVEMDGDIHDLQQEEDARRAKVLTEMGLVIVRFRNDDVLNNLPVVVQRLGELVQLDTLIVASFMKYFASTLPGQGKAPYNRNLGRHVLA